MKNRIFALALGAMLCISGGAYAQSSQQVLAEQGNWIALSFAPTPLDPPAICFANSVNQSGIGIAVWADSRGALDIRAEDPSWSLPADASGNIAITVNGHNYTYPASAMTAQMIHAVVTQGQLSSLVGDMETAKSMQVKIGSAKPTTISLDGSQLILTAFMTCAGLQNPSKNTGGSNPFSSSN